MLSLLLMFLLLFCLAGVLYPFPPFKTRKRAVGLSLIVFILAITAFSIEESDPEVIAERKEAAMMAVAEAQSAFELGDIETAKSIMEGLDYRAALQEEESVLPMVNKIEAAEIRVTLLERLRDEDTELDQKLIILGNAWTSIKNEPAKTILADGFEAELLELIKPLPASELSLNAAGYALLDRVDDLSSERNPIYKDKLNDYEQKIAEAKRAKVLASVRQATSGLNRDYDKIAKVTWFRHPNSPKYLNSRTTSYLYIGVLDSGGASLRLKTTYVAEDWLFIKSVDAFIDGETYPLTSGRFDRDNNTKIWEWKDEFPTRSQLGTLRRMAEGREVILRFNGLHYKKDKVFSQGDKRALRAMLKAYEAIPQ